MGIIYWFRTQDISGTYYIKIISLNISNKLFQKLGLDNDLYSEYINTSKLEIFVFQYLNVKTLTTILLEKFQG